MAGWASAYGLEAHKEVKSTCVLVTGLLHFDFMALLSAASGVYDCLAPQSLGGHRVPYKLPVIVAVEKIHHHLVHSVPLGDFMGAGLLCHLIWAVGLPHLFGVERLSTHQSQLGIMGMNTLMSSAQRSAGLRDPFKGETLTHWLCTPSEGLRLETTPSVEEERDPE